MKIKLEEARLDKELLNNIIVEKDKENECLKCEIVSLRNKLKDREVLHSFESNTKFSDHIIDSQRRTTDEIGLGYKLEGENAYIGTT